MRNKPTKAKVYKQVHRGPPDRATTVYTYDMIRETDTTSWVTTTRSNQRQISSLGITTRCIGVQCPSRGDGTLQPLPQW
jgi:hypothetical protein